MQKELILWNDPGASVSVDDFCFCRGSIYSSCGHKKIEKMTSNKTLIDKDSHTLSKKIKKNPAICKQYNKKYLYKQYKKSVCVRPQSPCCSMRCFIFFFLKVILLFV